LRWGQSQQDWIFRLTQFRLGSGFRCLGGHQRGGCIHRRSRDRDSLRQLAGGEQEDQQAGPDNHVAVLAHGNNHNDITWFGQVFWFIMPRMKSNGWFNLIFLIALTAGIYFIVTTVRDAVNQTSQQANSALQPLSEANQVMQTQVAQLLHPTPTIIPDPVTYITEIRALARLETIQYSVEKVITAETGQGSFDFLFGDKLLFVAHGTVIAGIDMGKIVPEQMRYEGGVLYVTLPPAEVFIATLDNQKSYVYDRSTGIFTKGVNDLETLARQTAEQEILKAAMEDGILTQAQINAEAFLLRFFTSLGFPNTIFVK
jgi:hypothetical protein